MLLTKEIEIKISASNINHFKDLNYNNLFWGKIIIIPIEHLSKASNAIVHVKCDICGKERYIKYQKYIKNYEKYKIYSCKGKCAIFKNSLTNLDKYGYENVFQNKEIKNKIKESNIRNNGVEYPMQSEIIKKKSENTVLKKYGYKNVFQNEGIKDKSKKTNLKKRGVEYASQSDACKEKTKVTNIKKYGTPSPAENEDIKNKIIKTNLKKYGVKAPLQNKNVFFKQQKSAHKIKIHKQTGLYYRGTYEKHFLDFCYKNKITIKKGKVINYVFKGKKRVYFSDFYFKAKNLIIEIKSLYTYNKDLCENLSKQKECLVQGFNFIFIIDKNYEKFKSLIK